MTTSIEPLSVPEPRATHWRRMKLGSLVALLLLLVTSLDEHEVCASCGAQRITSRALHVPYSRHVEAGGRLATLAGPEHRHAFVRRFVVHRGPLPEASYGCPTTPWESQCVLRMEGLLDVYREDLELVQLGRKFARTGPGERDERTRIVLDALESTGF